jgi:hypothetical protein
MLGGPSLEDLGPANASTWLETEQTILEVDLIETENERPCRVQCGGEHLPCS